jgi:hypothetical protein
LITNWKTFLINIFFFELQFQPIKLISLHQTDLIPKEIDRFFQITAFIDPCMFRFLFLPVKVPPAFH